MSFKKIQSALISVYYKDRLEPIIRLLHAHGVKLYSTGGTQRFIESLEVPVTAVEDLTSYPSIFGGRVKTLHPKIFGGILYRREDETHREQADEFDIPDIDLVVVDLYPFEETVAAGGGEEEVIEKIDIGGISLIRAAAKNFRDVMIVSTRDQYGELENILKENSCATNLSHRKAFAAQAFQVSSRYDTAIQAYFTGHEEQAFQASYSPANPLRYGENPHQEGAFYGDLEGMFEQLNGKALSYNNLVDIDAACSLIEEFSGETAFAILKHTNACGLAIADSVANAYAAAFEADTLSAFGGVLITNQQVDAAAAEKMHSLFFEILIAPAFAPEALELLSGKKNRILLVQKKSLTTSRQFKSILNGVIEQDRDLHTDQESDLKVVTDLKPTREQVNDLLFASKLCKHTKSNAIVLAKDGRLIASGVGQTSRVDALRQAIAKAQEFGLPVKGCAMASDAFFPFADCVEIAQKEGIMMVIQPGGSVRDQDSIDFCNKHNMAMVFTGIRHFKH